MNAYKSYEVMSTELRMTLKMHLNILRMILGLHLVIVLVLVASAFMTIPATQQAQLEGIVQQYLLSFHNFDLSAAFDRMTQLPSLAALRQKLSLSLLTYLLWPGLIFLFHRRTRSRFRRRTVRGSLLISEQELCRRLRTSGPALRLTDSLSVPSSFEPRQFFVSGAPGTGKTTLISRVIADLKRRRAKGVVYDAKAGEFVARFYDPQTDLIYNPFDARSLHWNFFELFDSRRSMITDFDTIAAAVIPDERSTQAQFFVDTARKILASVLQYCYVTGQRSIRDVAEFLSAANLHKRLMQALEQMDAKLCSFISKPGSGQTQGVLSVLSQHARILNYMAEQPNQRRLNLHDWLSNNQPGLIFLPNAADQKETLKGIFSFFIDSLATALLSLRDDPDRRIFFLLDEVATLDRMQAIFELIKLGRSKGACFFVGIQEKSQLDHLYGEHLANSIINHCNNHIIFRCNDNQTAEYASHLLGEAENEAMESTYSAAYRETRDSESYHRSNRLDRLVLPSQIQTLPDLHFYIRLHGLPVAQGQVAYRSYPDVAPAFVPNKYFLSRNLKLTDRQPPGSSSTTNSGRSRQQEMPLDGSRSKGTREEAKKQEYPIDEFRF